MVMSRMAVDLGSTCRKIFCCTPGNEDLFGDQLEYGLVSLEAVILSAPDWSYRRC